MQNLSEKAFRVRLFGELFVILYQILAYLNSEDCGLAAGSKTDETNKNNKTNITIMQKKIFPMLALLCAVAQGAKAQNGWSVWDGSEKSKPQHYDSYAGISDVYVINNASELKYV